MNSFLDESSMPDIFAKVDRALARPGDIFDGDLLSMPSVAANPKSRFPVASLAFVRIGMEDVCVEPTGEERLTETS